MKILDKYSTLIFFAAKKYMQNGEYGSLMVEKDAAQVSSNLSISTQLLACSGVFSDLIHLPPIRVSQGWVVKATAQIPPHTLLCEYSGQVDFARHQIFNSQDDTMDLIRSPHSATRSVFAILFHSYFYLISFYSGFVFECASFYFTQSRYKSFQKRKLGSFFFGRE